MGNAVRYKSPTRRKKSIKVFLIIIFIFLILAVGGHFAYCKISEYLNSNKPADNTERPEIIYVIEEEDEVKENIDITSDGQVEE